jgi:hypothetical protein
MLLNELLEWYDVVDEVADAIDSESHRLSWRLTGLVLMLEKLLEVLLG